ncbi:MAG: hypothetical protein AB7K09_04850 [Planctomycetota bacterium]
MTDAVARFLGHLTVAAEAYGQAAIGQEAGRLESDLLASARQDVMAGLEYLANALIACGCDGFAFLEIEVAPGRMTAGGMAYAFVQLRPMEAVIRWTEDRSAVRYEIRFGTRNAAGHLEMPDDTSGNPRQRYERRPRRKGDWAIVVNGQRDLSALVDNPRDDA